MNVLLLELGLQDWLGIECALLRSYIFEVKRIKIAISAEVPSWIVEHSAVVITHLNQAITVRQSCVRICTECKC